MSVDLGYFSLSEKMSENVEKTETSNEEIEKNVKQVEVPRRTQAPPPLLERLFSTYWGLSLVFGAVSMVTVLIIAADECRQCFSKQDSFSKPGESITKRFRAYGMKNVDGGHLKEVFTVLERMGYRQGEDNEDDWDLLWAHDYPFRILQADLKHLKPHQKVNHFPGCGYVTNKVDLATSGLPYIPPAFKLPEHKEQLLEYSRKHPNTIFVQKHNMHRHVKIVKLTDVDLEGNGSFVQKYVDRPLLVGGHRFDIGIYTVVTSVDPLRVYIYNGEALLRFCPDKYHPFDPSNLDKYVVGDDYLPIWKVPELDQHYNKLGFGMRDSLNAYLKEQGQEPHIIWEQIEDSIRKVLLAKEPLIADVLKRYKYKSNFFEMMRFDFVVDEDLEVFLLEANMSPNLSSAHFPPNRLLYQQVLYNVLGLVGVGERVYKNSLEVRSQEEEQMIVSDKLLATYPDKCSSDLCRSSCLSPECQLCKACMSRETKNYLAQAYKEYVHRGDCKRVFPPAETQEEAAQPVSDEYSAENQMQYRWFRGKCLLDRSWC